MLSTLFLCLMIQHGIVQRKSEKGMHLVKNCLDRNREKLNQFSGYLSASLLLMEILPAELVIDGRLEVLLRVEIHADIKTSSKISRTAQSAGSSSSLTFHRIALD